MQFPRNDLAMFSVLAFAASAIATVPLPLPETINTGGPIAFLCVVSETKPDKARYGYRISFYPWPREV